jgi:cell division protein ZapA
MAQVTVRINGYAYTVGCQDGEEQHLQQMAEQVERRIDSIKAVAGQSGESRMLVMAALLMADDLFEMGKSLKAAQVGQSPDGETVAPPPDTRLNRRLGKLAKRAEDIAAELGQP